MKEYIKMVVFIVILGTISAAILIGVDILTKDRIAANKEIEFQQTILDANNIEYTQANIEEVYKANIEIQYPEETPEGEVSEYIIYVNKNNGILSFRFAGNGLWGPIKGVLTLQSDFKTIKDVAILEQEETPGLGALVGERKFLDTLTGKVFDPIIEIVSQATGNSQVDSISGATGTSNAFAKIINDSYKLYYQVFRGGGILPENVEVMKTVMLMHGYEFNDDYSNIEKIFNESYKVHELEGIKVYENIEHATFTFNFVTEKGFSFVEAERAPIYGMLALESDMETIFKIMVTEHSESRGAELLKEEALDKAIGFKITDPLFKNPEKPETGGNIDGVAGVTTTTTVLNKGLKDAFDKVTEAFGDTLVSVLNENIKKLVLEHYGITSVNISDDFNSNFKLVYKDNKVLVTKEGSTNKTLIFSGDVRFGRNGATVEKLTIIATVKDDFKTIVKLSGDFIPGTQWGKVRFLVQSILDVAIDKDLSNLVFKYNDIDVEGSNELIGDIDLGIDGSTSTTTNVSYTVKDFNKLVKDNYDKLVTLFKEGN